MLINPSNTRDCVSGNGTWVPSFISEMGIDESETNAQCDEVKTFDDSNRSSNGSIDDLELDLGKFETPLPQFKHIEKSDCVAFLSIIEKVTDDFRGLF